MHHLRSIHPSRQLQRRRLHSAGRQPSSLVLGGTGNGMYWQIVRGPWKTLDRIDHSRSQSHKPLTTAGGPTSTRCHTRLQLPGVSPGLPLCIRPAPRRYTAVFSSSDAQHQAVHILKYGKLQDHGRWRTQLARHAAERLNILRRTLLHAHTRSVRLLIYQKRVVRLYKQSTPRFVPLCSRPVSALGHTAHAQNRMLAGSMSGSAPSSIPCIGSCSSKAVGNACPVRTYSPLRLSQLLPGVGGVLRLLRVHVSQRN
ncbi:hypothetical protein OH76DRAFT_821190 [Lentinus brumalis]|uniref:Uncharacterized protein n=1 Tax=Lentinus brumalis TaxID=2498619 RepID=A0A371D257_9APHY|nr:hypothetical protein OH76DRAFT_821190 [Polyporus brumalis]